MKQVQKHLLAGSALIIGFFAILGWIGDADYAEQVIYHMSQEDYDRVRQHLMTVKGEEPTEKEIAHWWQEHHDSK